MKKVLVLNVVALTPRLLQYMPRLRKVVTDGYQAQLDTVLPAVTCTAQSTFLTGELPTQHGIVGDRNSTRLNSSHVAISYAHLCLHKHTESDPVAPVTP